MTPEQLAYVADFAACTVREVERAYAGNLGPDDVEMWVVIRRFAHLLALPLPPPPAGMVLVRMLPMSPGGDA